MFVRIVGKIPIQINYWSPLKAIVPQMRTSYCGNKAFLNTDMTDNAPGQMSVIRLFSGKQVEKITYRLDTYLLLWYNLKVEPP